jgi:hypothetical protein
MSPARLILSTVLFSVLVACTWTEPRPVPDWIIGDWEMADAEGRLVEHWSRVNDTLMKGHSFQVVGSDTVFSETMECYCSRTEVYYIPTVPGQNGGRPVVCRMEDAAGDSVSFVNPDHDFPSRIVYRKVGRDSLIASIEGMIDGTFQRQELPMKRQ